MGWKEGKMECGAWRREHKARGRCGLGGGSSEPRKQRVEAAGWSLGNGGGSVDRRSLRDRVVGPGERVERMKDESQSLEHGRWSAEAAGWSVE